MELRADVADGEESTVGAYASVGVFTTSIEVSNFGSESIESLQKGVDLRVSMKARLLKFA